MYIIDNKLSSSIYQQINFAHFDLYVSVGNWISISFINLLPTGLPSFLLVGMIYDRAAAAWFCSIPRRNSARKIATRKAMPNNRRYSVQDARDKSCWNELKRNGNGETESKRNAPTIQFKKNVKVYLVIGCSQLTGGGNDGDERDSIAYYARSYCGQYRCHLSHTYKSIDLSLLYNNNGYIYFADVLTYVHTNVREVCVQLRNINEEWSAIGLLNVHFKETAAQSKKFVPLLRSLNSDWPTFHT